MTAYNRSFDIDLEEMELIEGALRSKVKALSLVEGRSFANERQLRELKKVLGRLHDQKVFYRPKQGYISG